MSNVPAKMSKEQTSDFLRKLADQIDAGNAKMTQLKFLSNDGYVIRDNERQAKQVSRTRQFVIHMEQNA